MRWRCGSAATFLANRYHIGQVRGHGVQPDRSQGGQARGVLPSCAGTRTWPGSQQRDGPRQRPQVLPVDGPWPVTPGSGERLLGQLLGNTSAATQRAQGPDQPRGEPAGRTRSRPPRRPLALLLSTALEWERLRRPAGSLLNQDVVQGHPVKLFASRSSPDGDDLLVSAVVDRLNTEIPLDTA